MNITSKIREKIDKFEDGTVFSNQDFLEYGEKATINRVLSRLHKSGEIEKATRGIFYIPKVNKYFGKVPANSREIVIKYASNRNEILQIHGAEAARILGLSTQMPMIPVFHTSGSTRKIKIRGREASLRHTSNKRLLQHAGTLVGIAISALWFMGKHLISAKMINLIKEKIGEENYNLLKQSDLTHWMREAINEAEALNSNKPS